MPLSWQSKIDEFCGMRFLNIVLKIKAESISFTITKVEKQKFPTEFLHEDRNQNDLFRSQCLTADCAQRCVRKCTPACKKEALLSSRYTVCKVPDLLSERTHVQTAGEVVMFTQGLYLPSSFRKRVFQCLRQSV